MLNSKLFRTAFIVLGLISIAACGQKGPLYLKDEQPPANTSTTEKASEAAQTEEQKQEQ